MGYWRNNWASPNDSSKFAYNVQYPTEQACITDLINHGYAGKYSDGSSRCGYVEPPSPTGSIYCNSVPAGAKIFIDGTDTGQVTPATISNVSVGTHVVRLDLSGYAPYYPSSNPNVIANQTVSVSAVLTKITITPPNGNRYCSGNTLYVWNIQNQAYDSTTCSNGCADGNCSSAPPVPPPGRPPPAQPTPSQMTNTPDITCLVKQVNTVLTSLGLPTLIKI